MKGIVKLFLLTGCALLFCASCSDLLEKNTNYGYPTNVTVSAKGGITTISGDGHIHALSLFNYYGPDKDEILGMGSNGQFWYQTEWFFVMINIDHGEVYFTAEPNTTGEPRSVTLGLWLNEYDGYYATVKVVQEAE